MQRAGGEGGVPRRVRRRQSPAGPTAAAAEGKAVSGGGWGAPGNRIATPPRSEGAEEAAAAEGSRSRSEERAAPLPPGGSPPSLSRSSEPCPAPPPRCGAQGLLPLSPLLILHRLRTHTAPPGWARGSHRRARVGPYPRHVTPQPEQGAPRWGRAAPTGTAPTAERGSRTPGAAELPQTPAPRTRPELPLPVRWEPAPTAGTAPRASIPRGVAPIAPNACSSPGCARTLSA